MNKYKLIALVAVIALLGAGCKWFAPAEDSNARNAFRGLDPLAAAEKIQFLPGDSFDVTQRMYGFEALVPGFLKDDTGVRKVTVTRFAPMNGANLEWETTLEVETDASKQEREAYAKALDELSEDAPIPVRPSMSYETRAASGTLEFINIKNSHSALFPAYWQEGKQNAIEEFSAMWLSDDAFQELSRTGKTSLSFNVFHESSAKAIHGVNELQDAFDALKNESQVAVREDRKDIDLVEMIDDSFEYDIMVDGKTVTVEAMKARNWFGEIIILKNRQNPMILELNINPLAAGVNEAIGEKVGSLQDLFGYKVTNFTLKTY